MDKITLEQDGEIYEAEYEVFGDDLHVYLPDGSTRTTRLNTLHAESAALPHLKSYIRLLDRKTS